MWITNFAAALAVVVSTGRNVSSAAAAADPTDFQTADAAFDGRNRQSHLRRDDRIIDRGTPSSAEKSLVESFPDAWRELTKRFFRPVSESTAPLVAVGSPDEPGGFVPALGQTSASRDGAEFVPPLAAEFAVSRRGPPRPPEIAFRAGADDGGGSVTVSPLHVENGDDPALYNGTVAYETVGAGRSFWGPTDDGGGYEEWIYVPETEVSPGDVVGSYSIEGAKFAKLEKIKDKFQTFGFFVVRVEDGPTTDDAAKLLEVQAPVAYDKDGNRIDVSLDVRNEGRELEVSLTKGSAAGPFLVDPVWLQSDNMLLGRRLHTATILPDGRVLVAGGIDSTNQVTNTVEMYDPVTKMFTPRTPMPSPGTRSSASVLLDDGRVLITHGSPSNSLAVLYDVTSDSWAVADPDRLNLPSTTNTRLGSRVVKLPNGQVLLSGNWCCPGNEAHIYDPPTDTFHSVASMSVRRLAHTLTVLPDGSVLAAGGGTLNPSSLISNTAELFVPDNSTGTPSYVNGNWVPLANNMNAGHFDHEAALIEVGPDAGKVLICAGGDGSTFPGSYIFTYTCELYDPTTQDFTPVANIPRIRQRGGTGNGGDFLAAVKSGPAAGAVVAAGGWPSTYATNVYDPFTRTWSSKCNLIERRLRHQTIGLLDGSIAVFGGQMSPNSQALRGVELLSFQDDDDDCDGIPNLVDICPTGVCGVISGMVFNEKNETCGDKQRSGTANVMVRADQVGTNDVRYAFTDIDGLYALDLPPGTWNLSLVDSAFIEEIDEFGSTCEKYQRAYIYNVNQFSSYSNVNFALKANCEGTMTIGGSGLNGTFCNGLPYATPCPGFAWEYCFTVTNVASASWVIVILTVTIPEGMTFLGIGANPCGFNLDSVTTVGTQEVVTVSISPGPGNSALGQNDQCQICFQTFVDFIPSGGWTAIGNATGQSSASPNDTPCAYMNAALTDTDACGCDPNAKYVYPAGCDDAGTYPGGPLAYTVRFQNEGLGPAYDVSVLDQIDNNLDLETMYFRGMKYPATNIQINELRTVYIRFDGINLAAAKDDFEGSQGYIHFDLAPSSATGQGDEFANQAEIYFDQNEVVITNEVRNTIGSCNATDENRSGLGDGTNPGQGSGTGNSPNAGGGNPNNVGR